MRPLLIVLLCSIPAFAAGGTCPTGNQTIDPNGNAIAIANVGVNGVVSGSITSCFFISKANGSDSNDGTAETTGGGHGPWAHLPGMPSCTSTCASTTPTAGEGFILRGGDTWVNSDLGVAWTWSGNSSHALYVGIDSTWFNASCGASWCRPIFAAGQIALTANSNLFQEFNQNYVIVDNIEVTGMLNDENGFPMSGGNNDRVMRTYVHDWAHTGSSDNVGIFATCGAGTMIDHNIVDGSDSSQNTFNGVYSSCAGTIAFNYFAYLVSGILADTDIVHDNTIVHTITSADGDHCNALFTMNPATALTQLIYNNFINNGNSCPGGVVLWFNGNGSPQSNDGWGFNNVMWGLSSNPVNIGNHGSGNYGTYHWFNNTVDCTLGGCGGTPPSGPTWTIYDNNNHVIPSALNFTCSGCTVPVCSIGTGTGCTDLTQTEAVANGQGYTSSNNYAPTNGSGSTVGAGTNLSSYCTTLSGINAPAGTACASSGGVGCSYNTSNHTLSCPLTAENSRPASAAWDIGAFQFAGGGGGGGSDNATGAVISGAVIQ